MRRHETSVLLRSDGKLWNIVRREPGIRAQCELTVLREIEKPWHRFGGTVGVTRIREAAARVTKLVEERMAHRINCREALGRRVLKQSRDQIDGFSGSLTENLQNALEKRS